ncbi:hypothetical protein FOG51_00596 [Hanseniaspora uvarum]|nr:hypothetical protein FOG51_00596 [Hanseniaspora uvarum]KAF0277269.1 hypothetical protein FOG50_01898 [Hanseniaspora uvarum]
MSKLHFKGNQVDFILLLNDDISESDISAYKSNDSIDLAKLNSILAIDNIYTTQNKRGNTGELIQVSKQEIENEFNTHKLDTVKDAIVRNGTLIEIDSSKGFTKRRYSNTNPNNGFGA